MWQALTSAEFSRKYCFGFAIEMEPQTGGAFAMRAPDGSPHIDGKVIACDPPRKLTVTWNVNWPGVVEKLGQTLVTYEIDQAGDAVRLTVTESHDRVLDDDILSGGRSGWPAILSSLKSLLETGHPLTVKTERTAAYAGGAEETWYQDAVGAAGVAVQVVVSRRGAALQIRSSPTIQNSR